MGRKAGLCSMNILSELSEIKRLLNKAQLIDSVRKEVAKVRQAKNAMVSDGKLLGRAAYEVVVLNCDGEAGEFVARRIRAGIKNVAVDKLVDGVIGIKTARRGKVK